MFNISIILLQIGRPYKRKCARLSTSHWPVICATFPSQQLRSWGRSSRLWGALGKYNIYLFEFLFVSVSFWYLRWKNYFSYVYMVSYNCISPFCCWRISMPYILCFMLPFTNKLNSISIMFHIHDVRGFFDSIVIIGLVTLWLSEWFPMKRARLESTLRYLSNIQRIIFDMIDIVDKCMIKNIACYILGAKSVGSRKTPHHYLLYLFFHVRYKQNQPDQVLTEHYHHHPD